MNAPLSLHDNPLYLIGEIGKAVRDRINGIIQEHGYDLSPEQFTILVILWYEKDGIMQSELIERLGRDKTTISRVLGRMLKNKLIMKSLAPGSGRENYIQITKKGQAIQEVLVGKTGAIYMQALAGVTDSDLTQANEVLKKIFLNLV